MRSSGAQRGCTGPRGRPRGPCSTRSLSPCSFRASPWSSVGTTRLRGLRCSLPRPWPSPKNRNQSRNQCQECCAARLDGGSRAPWIRGLLRWRPTSSLTPTPLSAHGSSTFGAPQVVHRTVQYSMRTEHSIQRYRSWKVYITSQASTEAMAVMTVSLNYCPSTVPDSRFSLWSISWLQGVCRPEKPPVIAPVLVVAAAACAGGLIWLRPWSPIQFSLNVAFLVRVYLRHLDSAGLKLPCGAATKEDALQVAMDQVNR